MRGPFSLPKFMESLFSIFRMHWDHEPGKDFSLSPPNGERVGVRGSFSISFS